MKVSRSLSAETPLTGKDDVDWAKAWLDEILREDEFFVSSALPPRPRLFFDCDRLTHGTDLAYPTIQQTPKSQSWQPRPPHRERRPLGHGLGRYSEQ